MDNQLDESVNGVNGEKVATPDAIRNRDGSTPLQLDATDARRLLGELMNRVQFGSERVLIVRRGKVIAALVPVVDLEVIGRGEAA